MSTKERIDVLLVESGFFETREKAKAAIMAGLILVGNERIDKPGTKVLTELPIKVQGQVHPYVSRGGLKLEKAIQHFSLSLQNRIVLDIGASTGGFTDCALQNGAERVYAVDVGYGQLAWSLRQNPSVTVMERTNFRHATLDQFKKGQPDFATIDVSFISLKIILPVLNQILATNGEVATLIKPQFEAGKEAVGKNGIVREAATHIEVLNRVLNMAVASGFEVKGATHSPITGGEGNIEFLAYLQKSKSPSLQLSEEQIRQIVIQAHEQHK